MIVRKVSIPFHRLYTKQWKIESPEAVLEKMDEIQRTGKMPKGIESDDVLITVWQRNYFVREGTHRILALILLGRDVIYPQEYRLVAGQEHQEYVRQMNECFPELKTPRSMIAMALEFGPRIAEAARRVR